MKTRFALVVCVVLGMLATVAPFAAPAAAQEPVTIGYSCPELAGGQMDIQLSLSVAAGLKGWRVITANARADAQRQNDDIDYFISLGVDAIVAVPFDSAAICAGIEKATAAGIPFYTIDRSPSGCKINMTVLSDNRQAGQQSGQAVVDFLTQKYGEPKGKVLEITGNLGQNVGVLRRDGFHDILDKQANIQTIQKVGDWQADKGQNIVTDVATANPDLDAIYMHSDFVYMSGTIAALRQLNMLFPRGEKGHIFLAAVDGGPIGLQAIRDGWADQCSTQPVPDFGIVVNWIEQELNGQPVKEGPVVQEGALWSPAQIKINADGTPELFLSTTSATEKNASDPGLWGNKTIAK
jgi:ABC-type sugar transport system substrate-binding protein